MWQVGIFETNAKYTWIMVHVTDAEPNNTPNTYATLKNRHELILANRTTVKSTTLKVKIHRDALDGRVCCHI